MRRICTFCALFLAGWFLINWIVSLRGLQRWVVARGQQRYYFIALDWSVRLQRIEVATPQDGLAIGTSISAYDLEPEILSNDRIKLINLGLISSGLEQILGLARLLVKQHRHQRYILLEAAPLTFTRVSGQHSTAAPIEDFAPGSWSKLSQAIPVLRYQTLYAGGVLSAKANAVPEEIHDYFFAQFEAIDDARFDGHVRLPQRRMVEARRYLARSCERPLPWAAEDFILADGKEKFLQAVELLKRVTAKLVLWVPPTAPHAPPLPKEFLEAHRRFLMGLGLPVIDQRTERVEVLDDKHFNDCIHPHAEGARIISADLARKLWPIVN